MKTTTNPFKWLSYILMLIHVEKKIEVEFGEIDLLNIEVAASSAMEALANEVQTRGVSCEEFAYILYSLNEDSITYRAIYSLEMMYGKIPSYERERIADNIARVYYKLEDGVVAGENEYSNIYHPRHQGLDISMPCKCKN